MKMDLNHMHTVNTVNLQYLEVKVYFKELLISKIVFPQTAQMGRVSKACHGQKLTDIDKQKSLIDFFM